MNVFYNSRESKTIRVSVSFIRSRDCRETQYCLSLVRKLVVVFFMSCNQHTRVEEKRRVPSLTLDPKRRVIIRYTHTHSPITSTLLYEKNRFNYVNKTRNSYKPHDEQRITKDFKSVSVNLIYHNSSVTKTPRYSRARRIKWQKDYRRDTDRGKQFVNTKL